MIESTGTFVKVLFAQGEKRNHVVGDCSLGTSCRRLNWQLFFVTQIINQLFPFLESADTLIISENHGMPCGSCGLDAVAHCKLIQPFTHVRELRVSKQFVPGSRHGFRSFTRLNLNEYRNSPSVEEAAKQFVSEVSAKQACKRARRNKFLPGDSMKVMKCRMSQRLGQ